MPRREQHAQVEQQAKWSRIRRLEQHVKEEQHAKGEHAKGEQGLTYVELFFNSEPETQLSSISCEDAMFSPVMLLPISMLLHRACCSP
jgi:hypothetical protein